MHARSKLGRAGEGLAADLYRRAGFRILDRNFRSGREEIDLVASRGGLIVFCEVKTRRSDEWGLPSEAVHPRKQAALRRVAGAWLSVCRDRIPRSASTEVRFDVVSVIVRDGRAEATLITDAF
jgi:putative endonuclease